MPRKHPPRKPEKLTKLKYWENFEREKLGEMSTADRKEFRRLFGSTPPFIKLVMFWAAQAAKRAYHSEPVTPAEEREFFNKLGILSAELAELLKSPYGRLKLLEIREYWPGADALPEPPSLLDDDETWEAFNQQENAHEAWKLQWTLREFPENLSNLSLSALKIARNRDSRSATKPARKPEYSIIAETLVEECRKGTLPFKLKKSESSDIVKAFRLICRVAEIPVPDNSLYHVNKAANA